jgi:hypothetical protein
MPVRIFIVAASAALAPAAQAQGDWLSLGSKHWAPAVVSRSGIGTANATAEAKVTRKEIEGWCANWSPGDRDCVRRELSSPEAQRTYRASADCTRGRITAVDGNTYSLAGKWDASDVGAGRTRWRDASGRIVGRDNASGGLAIAQQWEVLCPETKKTAAKAVAPQPKLATAVPSARYAVGQIVDARYGSTWVRGRVVAIRRQTGARGTELAYDVMLVNGKRGLLPERMLRRVPNR